MIIASQKENVFKMVCSEKDTFILNFKQYLMNYEKNDHNHLHIAFFKKEKKFVFEFKNKKSIFYKKDYFYPVTVDISQFDFKKEIEFNILYDKYVSAIKRIENKMLLNTKSNYLNFKQGTIAFDDLNELGVIELNESLIRQSGYRSLKPEKIIINNDFLNYLKSKNSIYKIWNNYVLDQESLLTVFEFLFSDNIEFDKGTRWTNLKNALNFIYEKRDKKVKNFLSDDYVDNLFYILQQNVPFIKKDIEFRFLSGKRSDYGSIWSNFEYVLRAVEEKYHVQNKLDDLLEISPNVVITGHDLFNLHQKVDKETIEDKIITKEINAAFNVMDRFESRGNKEKYLLLKNHKPSVQIHIDYIYTNNMYKIVKEHPEMVDSFINQVLNYYENNKISEITLSKADMFALKKIISKDTFIKLEKVVKFIQIDNNNNIEDIYITC